MKTNWPAVRNGCLILASLACGTAPMLAQSQVSAGATPTAAVISSVAVMQASQRASVRVKGEGRLEAHAALLHNPDRLVLDFADTRMAVQKMIIPGVSAPVREVRLGQYRPGVARVVVDLTAASPYQIARDGDTLVIYFDSPADAPIDNTLSPTTAAVTEAKPAFHYADAAPRSAEHRQAALLNVAAPRFSLPNELTNRNFSLGFFDGNNQPARPEESVQQATQQAVQQASNAAATLAPAAQQSAQTTPVATSGKYTGEPISVNLKDVDLRDFFRLIHEISGLNVVLDPAVKGNLTIVLDEVPWDQALDIVLQNNGLDKELHGNVLRIATRDTMKKEADSVRELLRAQNDATPAVTVTRVLSYAKATTLMPTLKKFLSTKGDILADDRSNQLIIRDIPITIPIIDNLIHQLDRKSQQVEIEARVVSANRSFAQDIGTELGFAGTTTSGRSLFSGSPAVGGSGIVPGSGIPQNPISFPAGGATSGNGVTTGLPLQTNFQAGSPTSGFGFSHRSPNFAVDFFITAAESKGVGKLLSKPRIVTQNNEKATVKQGTKIPIQTTINNTVSVQYIDAVLKLEVTPQITAEGTVFMDVIVENTNVDNGIARIQGIPALDTQSAETKVLVSDGGTVVIGGVIVTQQNVTINQTPIVGSLPLIGNLFKRTNVNVTSQELLFFLTPRIIPG
jgi:type IV pilus assembly protein PilQ